MKSQSFGLKCCNLYCLTYNFYVDIDWSRSSQKEFIKIPLFCLKGLIRACQFCFLFFVYNCRVVNPCPWFQDHYLHIWYWGFPLLQSHDYWLTAKRICLARRKHYQLQMQPVTRIVNNVTRPIYSSPQKHGLEYLGFRMEAKFYFFSFS